MQTGIMVFITGRLLSNFLKSFSLLLFSIWHPAANTKLNELREESNRGQKQAWHTEDAPILSLAFSAPILSSFF